MSVALLIFFMALVTFLPRLFPAFAVEKLKFNKYFERFLKLIPYTAMTALIFPGVLSVDPARWYVGVIGAAVAIGISFIPKISSGIVVIASVLSIWFFFI